MLTIILFILRGSPAVLFLGIWFAFQLLEGSTSLASPQAGGGVAFFAHIGGFVFGLARCQDVPETSATRPGVLR